MKERTTNAAIVGDKPTRLKLHSGGFKLCRRTEFGALWEWTPGLGQVVFARYGAEWIRANCVLTDEAVKLAACCEASQRYEKPAKAQRMLKGAA